MTQEVASGDNQGMNERDEIIDNVTKVLESATVEGNATAEVTNNGLGDNSDSDSDIYPDGLGLSVNARFIIVKRYLLRDDEGNPVEDVRGLFQRVAGAVSLGSPEKDRLDYELRYFNVMSSLKFLPNSPTIVNAGSGRGCLSACFVVSPDDNIQSIMEVANDAAMIEKWGGGIGFGLSGLRPKQDQISTTHFHHLWHHKV